MSYAYQQASGSIAEQAKMQSIGSVLGSTQSTAMRVSLTDQICRSHEAMDRLYSLAREIENRLGSVLDPEPPTQEDNAQSVNSEPPALNEMDRLITRIHTTADYLDRIHARTRL